MASQSFTPPVEALWHPGVQVGEALYGAGFEHVTVEVEEQEEARVGSWSTAVL